MPEEQFESHSNRKQGGASPREMMLKYLHYLPWVILSVSVMLLLAYIKLRYSTPIYAVNGKLLVKKSGNPYSNSGEKFDDIFMLQGGANGNSLNDEMELIRSRSMAARVVKSQGLQLQYFNKGKIRTSAISEDDMPFRAEFSTIADSMAGLGILVTVLNEQQFRLNDARTTYYFNQPVVQSGYTFKLTRTATQLGSFASNIYIISWRPLEDAANDLSKGINVAQSGDFNSNVLSLSYQTENTKIGLDIVNGFMHEYEKASLEDKRQIAVNTLNFIDEQLKSVQGDLGSVEKNLQLFQERNRIFKPEEQSKLYFTDLSETGKQLVEQGVKLKIVDMLIKNISDRQSPHRLVSTTLGIEEPSFVQQVTEFNKLQTERETALKTTPATNPLIQNYDVAIEKIRGDMLTNLQRIRQGYELAIAEVSRTNREANQQISSIPSKQKQMLEVTRQQKIMEELYSYLLQKKLETAISSASAISNIKVLESARSLSAPVSPNRKGTYTIFLFFGLAIPVGIIFLREYLNDKVKGREDVERVTAAPILGEVGHASDGNTLVVTADNRDYIAEQFRIVRSNLQYMLPKSGRSVILVTSSFSGEGKSFVSTNLGAVLAISGKQTVILEFDIRKPKVMAGLGMEGRKGITNFIVGDVPVKDIIYPVPGQENLFVIPCGPVPPNPAELLLDEKVASLMEMLRMQFDCIILDSAPVGMVSDAITLGRFANVSIYVVRHNYTYKKQVHLIDMLIRDKKLLHTSIVINDVYGRNGMGGYYGYGSYGYGYGFGKSRRNTYFDDQRRNGALRRVRGWFSRKS